MNDKINLLEKVTTSNFDQLSIVDNKINVLEKLTISHFDPLSSINSQISLLPQTVDNLLGKATIPSFNKLLNVNSQIYLLPSNINSLLTKYSKLDSDKFQNINRKLDTVDQKLSFFNEEIFSEKPEFASASDKTVQISIDSSLTKLLLEIKNKLPENTYIDTDSIDILKPVLAAGFNFLEIEIDNESVDLLVDVFKKSIKL